MTKNTTEETKLNEYPLVIPFVSCNIRFFRTRFEHKTIRKTHLLNSYDANGRGKSICKFQGLIVLLMS